MTERRLKGRYELGSVLGRGAATTTHLARDHETGERCVVKVLSLASEDALEAHELLTREARVLQRLDHPRIPRLVDFFSEEAGRDTRVCLVQQYVEGKSLEDSVRAGGAWDEKETLALGVKLARVLEYLHAFEPKVLHRDVKPGNVIVTPGDRVYLVDFGAVRDHLPLELLHPSGATIVGTRGYMPIEQFEGHAVPGSDLYSLGATLVFALSGKEPAELGKRGMRLDFERHVSVSPGLARLLARLLEPDWRERPLSARELREELERLATQPSKPRPAGSRRGPWLGLGLALLLGAAGAAIVARGRPEQARPLALSEAAPPSAVEEPPPPPVRSTWAGFIGRSERKDAQGDPLPMHAVRRLGTVRFRHGGPVRAVAFTPDGASLVSAGADGSVSVWSATTGEERRRIELGEPATSLALAPDGSRMLVGVERWSTARLLRLDGRDVARLLPMRAASHPTVSVSEVAWSADGSALATRIHDTVDVWDASDGRHRRRLVVGDVARGLSFVGDARRLLVASRGGARIVDVASGASTPTALRGSNAPLAVSRDGRLAATDRSRLQLFDLAGNAPGRRLEDAELESASVTASGFSHDASFVVAGLSNGKLIVWDVAAGVRRSVLEAHIGSVNAVAVSRDGRLAASGGEDGQVRVFDLASGAARGAPSPHRGAVSSLDFVPRTGELLSAGQDGQLSRWSRAGSAAAMRSFERPASAVFAVSDSRIAIVEPSRAHVLDVASGWEVSSHPLPARGWRSGVALAPARGLLAAGGASALELLDLTSGSRRAFPVPAPEEPIAFSPDGAIVATLRETPESRSRGSGRTLVFRDAATGRELAKQPNRDGGPVGFACRSEDGSYFGFNSGLWRLRSVPRLAMDGAGFMGGAYLCAVSSDGRFFAFARDPSDPAIEVRERTTSSSGHHELQRVGKLRGHRGRVASLAFAPGSHTLVSGGSDTSILVWDLASLAAPLEAPPEAKHRPASRAQPRLLLTFEDGIAGPGVAPVRFPAEAPLAFVPGRVGRGLVPRTGLAFPEAGRLVLGDEFTLTAFFRVEPEALGSGVQQIVSSDLVSLDVRDGGRAHVFLHFVEQGGHASAELAPWLGQVQAGRWYHVGVSHRRSEKATRICVDGVCAAGPPGDRYSDRVGELWLARSSDQAQRVALDELAIFDRALTDDEIAQRAGLTKAAALATRTPPAPTSLARLPAEQEPLPREALPQGRDVTHHVSVEEKPGFRVYRFSGPLARAQTLDVDLGLGAVWVGTSLGLLRHDLRGGGFRQWDETAGLAGERLNEIAVVGGRVFADSYRPTRPGSITGTGMLSFDVATLSWTTLEGLGGVWDLWGDGSTLWAGTGRGAEARDLETGAVRRFTQGAGELVDDTVHCVRRHGETVAFGALGDYVQETKDFKGGGLTLWDRRSNRFTSYTPKEGLARAYSCDVFLDDAEVYVAHWDEERGLTRIDRRTGRVEALRESANGVEIGGVVLAGERDTLWIGQQGALVKLDRASLKATVLYEKDGLPGYIVSGLAVGEDAVWASLYSYGGDGVRSAGLVRFPRR